MLKEDKKDATLKIFPKSRTEISTQDNSIINTGKLLGENVAEFS